MIEAVITSSVLILAVTLVRAIFKGKISRRFSYTLWGLVLIRLLMPFSLYKSSISVMNVLSIPRVTNQQIYVVPISKTTLSEGNSIAVGKDNEIEDANSFGYSVLSDNGETVTRYAAKTTVAEILKLVWIIGGIAVGLWYIFVNSVFNIRLRKNRAAYLGENSFPLKIYIADGLASPCLFGLVRPAIYLTPKAAEQEASKYVLAHEYCHYRHGDHIWSLLRGACLAMYWWNPLVWVAATLSRADSELACDEAAIRMVGEDSRLAYGKTLIDMIAVRYPPANILCTATTMTGGKHEIKDRLNLIVKNPKSVVTALIAAVLIVAVAAGCAFTGAKETKTQDGLTPYQADAGDTWSCYRLGCYPLECNTLDGGTTIIYLTSITLRKDSAMCNFIRSSNDAPMHYGFPDFIAVGEDGSEYTLKAGFVITGAAVFECTDVPVSQIASLKIGGETLQINALPINPESEAVFTDRLNDLSVMGYAELLAYCVGSDGAYAEAAYSEMAKRFIKNPEEFAVHLMLPAYPLLDDYKKSLSKINMEYTSTLGFNRSTNYLICYHILNECTPEERKGAIMTLSSSSNSIITNAASLFSLANDSLDKASGVSN